MLGVYYECDWVAFSSKSYGEALVPAILEALVKRGFSPAERR